MPHVAFEDILPYRAADLYNLVMDFDRYPEIFDDIRAMNARRTGTDSYEADVTVKAPFKDFCYRCTVTGRPPGVIDIRATEGAFKSMTAQWRFDPQPDGCTRVRYQMDFDFGGMGFKNAVAHGFIEREVGRTKDRLKQYAAAHLTPVSGAAPGLCPA